MNEQQVYIEIGNRMRILRRWRGLNQTYVAKCMGLTRASITNAEMGRQRMPVWNLLQLAEILDVPPHVWLLLPDEWVAWCSAKSVVIKRREYRQVEKVVKRLAWVDIAEKVSA